MGVCRIWYSPPGIERRRPYNRRVLAVFEAQEALFLGSWLYKGPADSGRSRFKEFEDLENFGEFWILGKGPGSYTKAPATSLLVLQTLPAIPQPESQRMGC